MIRNAIVSVKLPENTYKSSSAGIGVALRQTEKGMRANKGNRPDYAISTFEARREIKEDACVGHYAHVIP